MHQRLELINATSKIDINYIPAEIMLSSMNLSKDFHVHSNYNDHSPADLTISNVLDVAEKKGLQTLAFTEHVRKTSGSWTSDYLKEIESLKVRNKSVNIIAGFEAKILSDGSIDCPDKYARQYFLVASFHTAYRDKQIWIRALEKAIQNPDVDVIGHIAPEPGTYPGSPAAEQPPDDGAGPALAALTAEQAPGPEDPTPRQGE